MNDFPDHTEATEEGDPFAQIPSDPPDPLAAATASPEEPGLGDDEFLVEPPEDDFNEEFEPEEPEAELPPGVEQGSLGGVNPSEEAAALAAAAEPEVEPEPESEVQEATDQDLLSAPQTGAQGITQLESEEEEGHESSDEPHLAEEPPAPEPELLNEPEPEPTPKPAAKPKRKRRRKVKDHGKGKRAYTILSLVPDEEGGKWAEQFEVVARSSEGALRQAYRKLSGNTEAEFTLVPVPSKYWNPEVVKGKVPEGALAIKVG